MYNKLNGQNVLVVGSGISGIGAVKLLLAAGAKPILYDGNEKLKPEELKAKLNVYESVPIYIGSLPEDIASAIERLVLSPGVPIDSEFVQTFSRRGIPIWSEVELAYTFEQGTLLG